jgi:hypothetical protein
MQNGEKNPAAQALGRIKTARKTEASRASVAAARESRWTPERRADQGERAKLIQARRRAARERGSDPGDTP